MMDMKPFSVVCTYQCRKRAAYQVYVFSYIGIYSSELSRTVIVEPLRNLSFVITSAYEIQNRRLISVDFSGSILTLCAAICSCSPPVWDAI